MQTFYPNQQQDQNQPQYVYDRSGTIVGVMQQPVANQSPMTMAQTPSWWPRNQQQVFQQPPQQNQRPQSPPMQGKWIKEEKEIVPMDIPQDGSVVVFPQTDLQVIYLKKWEGNGTITTVPYIPNIPQDSEPKVDPMQQFQENVQGRLTNIERALDALIGYISQPAPQQQANTRSKNSSKEEAK